MTTNEAAPNTESQLRSELQLATLQLEQAMESVQDLQRENVGWAQIGAGLDSDPSHDTLVNNANLVRAFSGMNPLMIRAKVVRSSYVFGSGVDISATTGTEDEGVAQDVSEVVTKFVDDPANQAAVFGEQVRIELENDNFDDGNLFFAHWVDPMTGEVQVRTLPFDEVTEVYSAPGDKTVPWYYLRQWTEQNDNGQDVQRKAWYPDLDYQPAAKIRTLKGHPILWPGKVTAGYGGGAAVYHLKVNTVGRSRRWGVGDGFAAMPWAKSYSGFLSDCAKLYQSLAKIAHLVSGSKNKTQMARSAAQAQASPAGGVLYGSDLQLQTPNFSGINPNHGRPFASMVAMATGVPVTILTADPGQEGARAVAETLDKPMRLVIEGRQSLWAEFYRASCGFAVEQAVFAPRGPLKGTVVQLGDRKVVQFTDDTDPTIEVVFPEIEDNNVEHLVESIVKADATGKLPPLVTLRLLLRALELEDAEQILEKYTDPETGEWLDPQVSADAAAGNAAADEFRRGRTPAGGAAAPAADQDEQEED